MTRWVNKDQATALTGAESLPITQGGVDRRVDPQQLANFPESRGAALASASTVDLATATGPFVHITGTTTITALGTMQAGAERVLVFDGVLTITHNGTSLVLPTGANITTAAGDVATFRSEGGGSWRCVDYTRADGTSLAGGIGSGDVVGPASAVSDRIAVFDGTTGKLLKDGGYTIAQLRALALTTPVNAQTGTAYTLALSDAFKMVCMDNAAANTLTVPPNSSVAFPVGTRIDIGQDGAGQTTIAAASGVTIRTPETLKIRKRWGKATIIKRATDAWDIEGNLEAAP